MASTWSALKVELQGTGDNSGSWGTVTNVNLGDAILGEAITGSATVNFATDADVTVTLTDSATTQAARNLRLNITESSTGIGSVRNLILGSGCQIEKFYLINNTGTGAKTVRNTTGTGISVPAGKATLVYNDGTNVVDGASYFTSLTLGSALPVLSGGTGVTTSTGSGNNVLSTSPTLVTPILGTPTSGTLTNATGLPISTGVSGLGTNVATFLATPSSANLAAALTDETGSGANVFANTPTLIAPLLGTPTSGVATNLTGLPLTTGVTGTLPVANGGTSLATLTANNVILGNGTSAPLFVAPSTSGNVLTSNGTTWASSVPAGGGISYTPVKTANYTAANNDGVLTNTTGGAFTVTLPTSPSVGNIIVVVDSFSQWGTNNLTINPTALIKIANNTAGDTLVCDITGITVTLVYTGATYGWNVSAQIGGNSGTVVTLAGTQTLTNKTIAYGSNTLTDVVGVTATQTLTNKTLTSPTLTTPVLGTPSSGTLSACTVDGTNKVGYQNIPLSGIKTASYTLVAGDVGKFIELGTGGTVVVPASVFTTGDAISIFNNTAASISCTCSAVTTVYKGGTDSDIASFSVTTRGVATILFITATVAVVTGNLA